MHIVSGGVKLRKVWFAAIIQSLRKYLRVPPNEEKMAKTNLSGVPAMTFHKSVNIAPLGNRVAIEVIEEDNRTTAGGLVLPAKDRERPLFGVVISVGEGLLTEQGAYIPIPLHPGDKIIFERYSGTEIRASDKPAVLVLEYSDIMAVLLPRA